MEVAWVLSFPWDIYVILGCFILAGAVVFWHYLCLYERRYFFWKARKMALLKSIAWLLVYGGSFAVLFFVVSLFLEPGWWRYFVGGGIWWFASRIISALGWGFIDHAVDAIFG